MNPTPYPFRDFVRVTQSLLSALVEHPEPFALLSGDTGTGKTAVLREIRTHLDRARHRVLYFSEARKLGAAGLVKVLGESLRVRTSMCRVIAGSGYASLVGTCLAFSKRGRTCGGSVASSGSPIVGMHRGW